MADKPPDFRGTKTCAKCVWSYFYPKDDGTYNCSCFMYRCKIEDPDYHVCDTWKAKPNNEQTS